MGILAILDEILELGTLVVMTGFGISMGILGFVMILYSSTGIQSKLMGIVLMVVGFTMGIQSMQYLFQAGDVNEEETFKDSTGIVISAEYVDVKDNKRGVGGYEVLMWDDKESEVTLFYEGNSFPYASGDRVEYTTQIDLTLKDKEEDAQEISKIKKITNGPN